MASHKNSTIRSLSGGLHSSLYSSMCSVRRKISPDHLDVRDAGIDGPERFPDGTVLLDELQFLLGPIPRMPWL